ncbi:MAG: transketolase C-terminal domain-containing protein [Candidatus Thorarchaeota archaeon]
MTTIQKPFPVKPIGMTGDEAVAQAVKLVDPDVIAAYPITPQTIIVERISDFYANGEINSEYVTVESEHSAMSACVGAASTGARVFTASSSQGILLMYEILFIAASARLPIVMSVANRAVSGPINIHGDLTDQMTFRDSGWISLFGEDNQEAYDHTVLSFRIAEHPDIQLPTAFGLDGFIVSHALEGVTPLTKEFVQDFIPQRKTDFPLTPEDPITIGLLALPDYYMELRYQIKQAMDRAQTVIPKIFQEWGERTGRYYNMLDAYQMEDADYAFLTLGAFAGNARTAVDNLRNKGEKVGLLKLRTFRPFPTTELIKSIKDLKGMAVVERTHAFGGIGAPVYSDIRASLYDIPKKPLIYGYTAGLGGRDVLIPEWEDIFRNVKNNSNEQKILPHQWWGVRR